jgi:hypothetical protein
MPADESPLHQFPDRAIRRLQAMPAHLRELVRAVAPALADRLDFDRAKPVERELISPDWRRAEADLLFEIPFRDPAEGESALVCVLIEHQSAADPTIPFRLLHYVVFYWEREHRRWQEGHARGIPLRLTPVFPVVLPPAPIRGVPAAPWPI